LTGDLIRRLRKLNPLFTVSIDQTIENSRGGSQLCGLFFGDMHVCSVPVPFVPDDTVRNEDGSIAAQGLRVILSKVVTNGILNKADVEREFRMSLPFRKVDGESMSRFHDHIGEYRRQRPHEFQRRVNWGVI